MNGQGQYGYSPLNRVLRTLMFARVLEQRHRDWLEFNRQLSGKPFIAAREKMDAYAQTLGLSDARELTPDQRRHAYFNAMVEGAQEALEQC